VAKLKLQFAERQFGGSFVRLFMKFPLFSGWRILCHRGRDGSVGTAKAVLYACGHYSGTKVKNQFTPGAAAGDVLGARCVSAAACSRFAQNALRFLYIIFGLAAYEFGWRRQSRTRWRSGSREPNAELGGWGPITGGGGIGWWGPIAGNALNLAAETLLYPY